MCSTTRYAGASTNRILTSTSTTDSNKNLVHGHWGGNRGAAFYGGWVSSYVNDTSPTWLIMCGKNTGAGPGNVYYDGAAHGNGSSNVNTFTDAIGINLGNYGASEASDFAFSNLLIWDQALTDSEMVAVYDVLNDYLATGGIGSHVNQIALTTESNVSLLLLANDNTYKGIMGGSVTNSNVTTSSSTSITYPPPPPCFLEGTQITVVKDGKEVLVNVEDLRPGSLVKTYLHGPKAIKIIGKRTCQNDKCNLHGALYKVQKTESMNNDLYISGGHGLLKDEAPRGLQFKIDDKYIHFAHQSADCEYVDDRRMCTYYNFCMEGDAEVRYGVYANGLLCETPSESQLSTFGLILL
jgi:hypothetical protein